MKKWRKSAASRILTKKKQISSQKQTDQQNTEEGKGEGEGEAINELLRGDVR